MTWYDEVLAIFPKGETMTGPEIRKKLEEAHPDIFASCLRGKLYRVLSTAQKYGTITPAGHDPETGVIIWRRNY